SDLSDSGLSQFSANSGEILSEELPWEGTFSVNVVINKEEIEGPVTLYSTDHFEVTLELDDETVKYVVIDANGHTVTGVNVDVEAPEASKWSHLIGADRDAYFAAHIPNKVELAFEGRDCWLNVININNRVFTSEVWGCLVPDSLT